MKKMILLGVAGLAVFSAQAQDFKVVEEKTFLAFDTTQDMNTKIEQSNKLTLIAKKWDNEWSAHYYASYSKAVLSYMEKDAAKRDAYLDEAEKDEEDAVTLLKKNNDETFVLAAMIANARLAVDPMQRWQKYGQVFTTNLENAKDLNPDNPRMYYLQGVSKYFTPKAYGGGKAIALPYFEKALLLYNKETSKDITMPHWGKEKTQYFLTQCKQGD